MRLVSLTMLAPPQVLAEVFFFLLGVLGFIWLFTHSRFLPRSFALCTSSIASNFDAILKHCLRVTTINEDFMTLMTADSKHADRPSKYGSSYPPVSKVEMDSEKRSDTSKKFERTYASGIDISHGKDILATRELKNFAREYKTLNQELEKIISMNEQEVNSILQHFSKRELEKLEGALHKIGNPWHPINVANLWGCRNLPFLFLPHDEDFFIHRRQET